MSKTGSRRLTLSILLAAGVIVRCSLQPDLAGGGASGTGNGIVGVARLPDGSPATTATVRVRPADYVTDIGGPIEPRAGSDTVCGADGSFALRRIQPGSYVMEITDSTTYCTARRFTITSPDTVIDFRSFTLDTGSQLTGRVRILGYADEPSLFVQVPGLERIAGADSAGLFSLSLLPRGLVTLRVVAADTAIPVSTIADIPVGPHAVDLGTRVVIPPSRARTIEINTTVSGASIAGDLHGFPLLVRLDATALDFADAGRGGDGVRFYRNGNELYHQVEQWDSALSTAAVWVRADTLFGDSLQEWTMTWQSATRSKFASPARAFDTSDGFEAVWHLAEQSTGVGAVDRFHDATVNGHHGTDSVSSDSKTGVIGAGQRFGGGIDCIPVATPVRPSGSFTASAWIRPDSIDFARTDPMNIVGTYDWNNGNPHGFVLHVYQNDLDFIAGDGTAHVSAAAYDKIRAEWMHVAAVFEPGRATVSLYANGVPLVLDNPVAKSSVVYGAARTYISYPTSQSFRGLLDEVRIDGVARSPDWIRLSYENQRPDQKVVRFR